jgi:phosphodiester glycosidase
MRALGGTPLALLVLLIWASTATASPTRTLSEDLHTGVHHEHWTDANPMAEIELIRVNLTSTEIQVFATPPSKRGITTSQFATQMDVQIAINGDAFAINGPYLPHGLAIGNTTLWSNTHDDDQTSLFHFLRTADGSHELTAAEIITPEIVVTKQDLPEGTEGAIGGKPLLVRDGLVEGSFNCDDASTVACQRAPRSAIGLSADGSTMWLVTVDGWQASSIGYTANELANFMKARGASMAMALDGGSSATMVVNNQVTSHPSDGVERSVANHIGVKYQNLSKGQLVGLICKGDVIKCGTDDSLRLLGAKAVLDDGRSQMPSDAYYSFQSITPRLACVTASHAKYKTKTQCHFVTSGIIEYNSIELEPEDGPGGDGGVTPGDDDGGTDPAPPAGCCDAGRVPSQGSLLLAAIVWASIRRRARDTTPRDT